MAKFCGNCGTQMPDDAKICGNCGTPFQGAAPSYTQPAADTQAAAAKQYDSPAKRALNKKIGILVCAGVALVLVMAILIGVVAGNVGYKGTVKKFVNALEEYDVTALEEMTSSCSVLLIEDVLESDVGEVWEAYLKVLTAEFDKYIGTEYKLKYEIISDYEATAYRMEDLLEDYYEMDGFDASMIDKMRLVNLRITAKGKNKERNKSVELVLSKEDGKWTLFTWDSN